MGWVSSTRDQIKFLSSLGWEGFGQYYVKDAFFVLVSICYVCSSHVERHCESSVAWDGFWSIHVEIHFIFSHAYEGFC